MVDAETYLRLLDGEAAGNWLLVGHVLSALEQHSLASPNGALWQDAIKERLEKAGHPVSTGHLYKIRRAHQFIQELAPTAVSQTPPPKISAVEVAERLHRLDPEAGKQALQDVLGPKPAAYVEIKKRYDQALEAKPEMKSARHLAWEKRKPDAPLSEFRSRAEGVFSGSEKGASAEELGIVDLPDDIQQLFGDMVEMLWASAWSKASKMFSLKVDELGLKVKQLEEELELQQEENRLLQEECKSLARMVDGV